MLAQRILRGWARTGEYQRQRCKTPFIIPLSIREEIMQAYFRSDNEAPVAEAIMDALSGANNGAATAYAEDAWSEQLNARFSDLFDIDTSVIPVSTGTVAMRTTTAPPRLGGVS